MRLLRSIAVLAAVSGLLVGCGGGSTPEGTFEKMKTVGKAEGMPGMLKFMTPESQNAMAGGMGFGLAMGTSLAKKFGKPDADAEAVLKKHNIDMEKLPKITGKEDMTKLTIDFGATIKDKPGFIKDLEELNKKKGKKALNMAEDLASSTLKDVKITGETAEGKIVSTKDGKENIQPVHFKLVGGEWLFDMIPLMTKGKK